MHLPLARNLRNHIKFILVKQPHLQIHILRGLMSHLPPRRLPRANLPHRRKALHDLDLLRARHKGRRAQDHLRVDLLRDSPKLKSLSLGQVPLSPKERPLHPSIVSYTPVPNPTFANTALAAGDRSHIPPNAQPIFEILSADLQRVKARAPAQYKAHVVDTEKRLSILFDHLNNEDTVKPGTVQEMVEISQHVQSRNYDTAMAMFTELMKNKNDEGSNWMVSGSYPACGVFDTDISLGRC